MSDREKTASSPSDERNSNTPTGSKSADRATAADGREARLAARLRDNLRRRKAGPDKGSRSAEGSVGDGADAATAKEANEDD